MVAPNRDALAPEPSVDFGTVYREHLQLLIGTAITRFHINESDAYTLAHDVFLAFFLKSSEIIDPRAWLLSAMFNATKSFLRRDGRTIAIGEMSEPIDPRSEHCDSVADRLMCREAFLCATPRCQLALRLRYLEGFTFPELASELHTTEKYAQNLVARCLRQANERYTAKGSHARI